MKALLKTAAAILALLCAVTCVDAQNPPTCDPSNRVDCGYVGITQQQCNAKGCCWQPTQNPGGSNPPWCFFPPVVAPCYVVASADSRTQFTLKLDNPGSAPYGQPLEELSVTIDSVSDSTVRVRITDPNNARWEIPESIVPAGPAKRAHIENANYKISTPSVGQPFSLSITRLSDSVQVFNLSTFQYSDQYLEFSTSLPADSLSSPNIYGLGEHIDSLQLPVPHQFTLFNADAPTPFDQNLYGSHPFYTQVLSSGAAHGLFFRNSNGQDVLISNQQITFRSVGGVMDFYVFMGSSPESVTQQYHSIIGFPRVPPYWSLGWHQCKYGWKSIQEVENVVANYKSANIPLDTIWGDIDYMDNYEDFSWDPVNYPLSQVQQFRQQLTANNQHYVVIVDPCIHNRAGYPPYDSGMNEDIFVMKGDNSAPFVATVWPGTCVLPDFFNPNTQSWWTQQIQAFLSQVAYDGLWIDMNEVSNFNNGQPSTSSPVNNPPYSINNFNSRAPLNTKTLAMDCIHGGNYSEYNVHNLFGLTEAIATSAALESVKGVRSFVLTRSTFPGSGAHVSHWRGDNHATFDSMAYSIGGIINMNLFGIPHVGADICGFQGQTTEELCARWTALGSFYPFSRNHHQPDGDQEPYLWPSVTAVAIKTLGMKYRLLPYLYTLFYNVFTNGGTVARSLLWNYPTDPNTYSIDQQFMWGTGLLISPCVTQGATSVNAYFPAGRWYSIWDQSQMISTGQWQTLEAQLEDIPVHVNGGNILPMQGEALTTLDARRNPFQLLVALDENSSAAGTLFYDDGIDIDVGANALIVDYTYSNGLLSASVQQSSMQRPLPSMGEISIWGVAAVNQVLVNGVQTTNFNYNSNAQVLVLTGLKLSMTQGFTVQVQ